MADQGNHRVRVLRAADGAFTYEFGSLGSLDGQFRHPKSVAYSPSGDHIAVADYGLTYGGGDRDNHRVQVLRAGNGTLALKFGSYGDGDGDGEFDVPMSVAYSPSGDHIAVADEGNHRVQVLRAGNGTLALKLGGLGRVNGQLRSPHSVAYSPSGDLIAVADTDNHRVQVLRAGNGTLALKLGGRGADGVQLRYPISIAFVMQR